MYVSVASFILGIVLSAALFHLHYKKVPPGESGVFSTMITLTEGGFEPKEVTLATGSTVTFVTEKDKDFWPASNIHPTHSLYPAFDPKRALKPAEAWSFTFDTVGEWRFHDHIQPFYTGVIHVTTRTNESVAGRFE